MMSRDMFQARVAEHQEIGMHELIYPVLQGYDSVALKSDVTIVGSINCSTKRWDERSRPNTASSRRP